MRVTAESLNLRANPGANQALVTKLRRDTQVTLLGKTQVTPDGGQWVKIRAGKHEGWVNQKFLK